MTKAQADEARARCEAATPGPWGSDGNNHALDTHGRTMLTIPDHPTDGEFSDDGKMRAAWYTESGANLLFAAHARTALPAYDAMLRRAMEVLAHEVPYMPPHIVEDCPCRACVLWREAKALLREWEPRETE